jgi:hypothetical protein
MGEVPVGLQHLVNQPVGGLRGEGLKTRVVGQELVRNTAGGVVALEDVEVAPKVSTIRSEWMASVGSV